MQQVGPFLNRFCKVGLNQVAVGILQLLHDTVAVATVPVEVGVARAELLYGTCVVGEVVPLVGHHRKGRRGAEVEQREGGHNVVVGTVAVLPFEVECLDKVFETVVTQTRTHETYVFQRVETSVLKRYVGT